MNDDEVLGLWGEEQSEIPDMTDLKLADIARVRLDE